MADEKLSNKAYTTSIANVVLWISRLISGTWTDFRINVSDLLNELTTNTQYCIQKTAYAAQTSSFTHAAAEYDKIESLDFLLNSGSCTIKVGTSAGTDDIVPEFTLTGIMTKRIDYPFASAATVYITITGTANIDMNVWYHDNIF